MAGAGRAVAAAGHPNRTGSCDRLGFDAVWTAGAVFVCALCGRADHRSHSQSSGAVVPAQDWLVPQVLTLLLLLVLLGLLGAGISYLAYSAALELASLMQNWDGLLGSLQTALDQLEALSAHLWNMVPPQLNDSLQSVVDGIVAWLRRRCQPC